MYFQQFPQTFYSLDDIESVQIVTNITVRNVVLDSVKNNYSVYDTYDIKDGETPEIVADKFYDNPMYHWIVLHMNDIIDPRFDWPLTTPQLNQMTEDKYGGTDVIHHYENSDGKIINANITFESSSTLASVGNVITNLTSTGTGFVYSKDVSSPNSTYYVTVTQGGFKSGDIVSKSENTQANVSIVSLSVLGSAIPVTAFTYEDAINDSKRRIKILKPQFIESFVNEFSKKLETLNG